MNELKKKVNDATTIYFVCSGNIIRSAYADFYARYVGIDKNIYSYGTTYPNTKIHRRSKQELLKLGIEETELDNFQPQLLDDINIKTDAVHFVMTSEHKNSLLAKGIDDTSIYLLSELLGKLEDIADPYFAGNYEKTYRTINNAIEQLNKLIG